MSLRGKLLLPALLIAALLAAYLYGVWMPRSLAQARADHLERVERHLDSVVEGLIPMLMSGQLDAVHENLDALKKRNRDWIDIRLVDERQRQWYPLLSAAAPAVQTGDAQEVVVRTIDYLDSPLGTLQVLVDFSDLQAKDRQHADELGAMLGGMALAFLATLWATLELTVRRPLHGLARASQELARQNFDVHLPVGGKDEVGTLIGSFSAMRGELRAYQAELESHRNHLEELVAERTRELESGNESLRQALDLVRQTQHELIESEKLASLGRLVAGFAHEINTPIGVAVGASSHALEASQKIQPLLLEDEVDEAVLRSLLGEVDEACRLASNNLARAADLVGRFKRTSVDQTRGLARLYNLNETLADVVSSLHDVLKRTPVRVAIDCADDILLYGYPGALGQIVTNLIINSVKHGFDDGSRQGEIQIVGRVEQSDVVIDYRDTGKGIAPLILSRVFEPFFTTARESGGSGLGLFICHNLATSELRGTMRCESEPGQGVRFVLRYPAESGTTAAARAAPGV